MSSRFMPEMPDPEKEKTKCSDFLKNFEDASYEKKYLALLVWIFWEEKTVLYVVFTARYSKSREENSKDWVRWC